jgi:hypothetical protein
MDTAAPTQPLQPSLSPSAPPAGALVRTPPQEIVAGTTERENVLEGTEISRAAETASTAMAAAARAQVQARFLVAIQRPRDIDNFRVNLLKDCKRPGFAAVARYHKPIGKGIEGPSIRFVEAALRHFGNVVVDPVIVYDDPQKRIVAVTATDLETNFTVGRQVVVEKTVERSKPMDDGFFFTVRKNSYGKNVYLVPAIEDDLLAKQGALVSKAMRTEGLRLLPGDIVEEAQVCIQEVLRDRAAKDPDAERKAVADAFASLNIAPSDLKDFLGHDLAQCSPAQLAELRGIYVSIKEGEITWKGTMAAKAEELSKAAAIATDGRAKTQTINEKLNPKK